MDKDTEIRLIFLGLYVIFRRGEERKRVDMFEFLARWFGRRRPEVEDPEFLARFQQLRERSVPPADKKKGRSDLLTRVREHEVQTNLLVRPRIPTGAEC
ncbi:MAG TPA: hypothetical protein V6D08_07785, partial [Candidatus Obscuribacterales bacterium]